MAKKSVPKQGPNGPRPVVVESSDDDRLLDRKMLDLLVCPQTKANLIYDEAAQELISEKARLAYPVRDGVPILLISEGRTLDDD